MYLENYLNENATSVITENVEPLHEAWITGEDVNELAVINNEAIEAMATIAENSLFAESLAYIAELQGDTEKASSLQEGVIGNIFSKVKETLIKMWQKVKAFFANLFKSIAISMGDVSKTLKDVDKYLPDDLSKYSYKGYKWSNTNIAETISSKVLKSVEDMGTVAQSSLDAATKAAKRTSGSGNPAAREDFDKPDKKDWERNRESMIAIFLGKSGEVTMAEAGDMIKEAYGCNGAPETIEGFSAVSISTMINFCKTFDKNKALNKLKSDTDKAYGKAVNEAKKCESAIGKLKLSDNAVGQNAANRKKEINFYLNAAKVTVTSMTTGLSVYNSLMGQCIACEKKKFKEYRSAIAGAVRHKAK